MAALDQQWMVAIGLGFVLFLGFSGKSSSSDPPPEPRDELREQAEEIIRVWNTIILPTLQYTGTKTSFQQWIKVNAEAHHSIQKFDGFCRQWLSQAERVFRELRLYGPGTQYVTRIQGFLREIDQFYSVFRDFVKPEEAWDAPMKDEFLKPKKEEFVRPVHNESTPWAHPDAIDLELTGVYLPWARWGGTETRIQWPRLI